MSAAGRDSPVSRKRRLGGGGAGVSGCPKVKRRLFAAGSGSRSTTASASSAAAAAAKKHTNPTLLDLWSLPSARRFAEREISGIRQSLPSVVLGKHRPSAKEADKEELVRRTVEDEEQAAGDEEEAEGIEGVKSTDVGSASSGASAVYLRGPARIPQPPPSHQRPVIRPHGQVNWLVVSGGRARSPNGILGLLCKRHFPGLVTYKHKHEPAYTFDHYHAAEDADHGNMAERVKQEFWTYFRCEEGSQARADEVLIKSAKKRVTDMHYEVKHQCVITYHGQKLGQKIGKDKAKETTLTREQYIEMIPDWCRSYPECWERIVDRWFTQDYIQQHNAARERRLMMQGPAHHQGSRGLAAYRDAWMAAHPGRDCNDFQAFCMSKKGKATSDVVCNLEDPPEAYTNPSIHTRIMEYTAAAKAIHGPEYDPCTQEIDAELVMRLGGGKKHGRLWIGNNIINSASLSLSEIRARSVTSDPPIRPQSIPSQQRVDTLQAELENEKKERQDMEARMNAQLEAERQDKQAQNARLEEQHARLEDLTKFLRTLGQQSGFSLPPALLAPLPLPPPVDPSP